MAYHSYYLFAGGSGQAAGDEILLPGYGSILIDPALARSPANTRVDPSAQYVFIGTVHDETGHPIYHFPQWDRFVLQILEPCANPVALMADGPTDEQGRLIWGVAKLNQGGGSCVGSAVVRFSFLGEELASWDWMRSPDQDGDGLIALYDLLVWQQAFVSGTEPWRGDLAAPFDALTSVADLMWWQKHFVASVR